jgi:hypothetical protein
VGEASDSINGCGRRRNLEKALTSRMPSVTQEDGYGYDVSPSETSTELVASWNESQENLLKAIAERSNCMRWLHTESTLYFQSLNFYFTIPNVVLSTLNGSITMSLSALFPDQADQRVATTIIGLVSIFSAVLITMNQYVKSQQMTEAHHSAGLAYSKLHRIIMNELSLRRDQRTNGLDFLKHVRDEIDHLESVSPSVLPHIIKKFNKVFADKNIEKPEIAGDLDEVFINREQKVKKIEDITVIDIKPSEVRAPETSPIKMDSNTLVHVVSSEAEACESAEEAEADTSSIEDDIEIEEENNCIHIKTRK